MTHSAPMANSDGTFGDYKPTEDVCAKCGSNFRCATWESSCGGYEDYHYKCFTCGAERWVDGIDS